MPQLYGGSLGDMAHSLARDRWTRCAMYGSRRLAPPPEDEDARMLFIAIGAVSSSI